MAYLGQISWEEYQAIPADVTKSELVYMDKSPLHYRNRKDLMVKTTEDMELGTLLHVGLLEPHLLKDSYVVEPETIVIKGIEEELNRRKKAHKEFLEKLREEATLKGQLVVTAKNLEKLTGMLTECSKSRALKALMNLPGESEVAATWEYMGFKWKGRADRLIQHPIFGRTVIEVKKTQNASSSAFSREIYNRSYDVGVSAYLRGFEADALIFVACESNAPYPIGIYKADDSMVERAHSHTDALLTKLRSCLEKDEWPGYTDDVENLLLPAWVPAMDLEDGQGTIEGVMK